MQKMVKFGPLRKSFKLGAHVDLPKIKTASAA